MDIIEDIIRIACEVWGVSRAEVLGKDRTQPLPLVRFLIAYEVRERLLLKHEQIAKILNKDRSSIYYYLDMYKQEMERNPSFRIFADKFSKKIESNA